LAREDRLEAVDSSVPAGSASPANPLANSVNPASVTIGGQPARVLFNGLLLGFADAVPVVLKAAGRSGGTVTMAIR